MSFTLYNIYITRWSHGVGIDFMALHEKSVNTPASRIAPAHQSTLCSFLHSCHWEMIGGWRARSTMRQEVIPAKQIDEESTAYP
jgi:hypothetical protein